MGEIILKAFIISVVLIAFAVPGFALKKLDMLGDGAKTTLSNILLYVCQPGLNLAAFTVFTDEEWAAINDIGRATLIKNFGITAAVSVLALGIVFALCKIVFVKNKNRSETDVYAFIAVFSNCGFLGIPFIRMFTDGNVIAVMYLMIFNLVFVVLCWTLGVYLISHNVKDISVKKVLLNPTIIATAVALVMFFVPEINIFMIDECRDLGMIPQALSTMTAPIAMILVGIALAELPIKSLFNRPGVYIAGALRLIAAPLVTFAVAVAFYYLTANSLSAAAENEYIFLAPVIAMAMSPASLVVAMTERFDGEKELAAAAYVTNTLFSVITIPLIIAAVIAMWGLL